MQQPNLSKHMADKNREIQIDASLIEQLQYFKGLFLKHYSLLCVYAMRYVNDAEISKDIVQECFIDIWEKRNQLDLSINIKPLLYKVVHDKAIDYTRHSFTKSVSIDNMNEHPLDKEWRLVLSTQIDDDIDCTLIAEEIQKCLRTLPPRCTSIFRMSREEGLSNKEIAEKLGISIKAVEKQMTKALTTLRAHLIHTGYLSAVFIAIFLILRK